MVVEISQLFSPQVPLLAGEKTVARWFKEAGRYSCWAAGKPLLTTAHIEARLQFANKMMGFDFSRVVFSDEKIWRIRQGGKVRVWRRTGMRFNARYTVPTVAKAEGIMVWAAINSRGEVVIRRCPTTVDSMGYQSVLKSAKYFIAPRCAMKCKSGVHQCIFSSTERLPSTCSFNTTGQASTSPRAPGSG